MEEETTTIAAEGLVMEVNIWEGGWDSTEGGVILVISLEVGSSTQEEWET